MHRTQHCIAHLITLTLNNVAEKSLQSEAERSRAGDFVDFPRFTQRRFNDVAVIVVKLKKGRILHKGI